MAKKLAVVGIFAYLDEVAFRCGGPQEGEGPY